MQTYICYSLTLLIKLLLIRENKTKLLFCNDALYCISNINDDR